MSRPRRHRRELASRAVARPPARPPQRDLLERALSRCDSPVDIARAAAVSLLFHASLAEQGIRLWARERGFELPAQPEGETCAVRWLCYSALLRESNPPARGGSRRAAMRRTGIQGCLATVRA